MDGDGVDFIAYAVNTYNYALFSSRTETQTGSSQEGKESVGRDIIACFLVCHVGDSDLHIGAYRAQQQAEFSQHS